MSKQDFYRQCKVVQETEVGRTEIVTWLPEKNLEVGYTLRLQDPISKEWKNGRWTVISMSETKLSGEQIRERIRLARRYRNATDV